jgi:hypothetical protein
VHYESFGQHPRELGWWLPDGTSGGGGGGGAPANGTYVSYNGSGYAIAGGAALYVSNWAAVGNPPVTSINSTQWDALDPVPANGTELDANGSVYVVAGGAPLAVSSCTIGSVQFCNNLVYVDPYAISALDHLDAVPANGTELDANGAVYVVAGGAPLAISSCTVGSVEFCSNLVYVDPYAISVLDHLNAVPADGTHVESFPSETFSEFELGGILPAASDASAVPTTDGSLSAFPIDAAPTITSASSSSFILGTQGSFMVTATAVPTANFTASGALPAGVSLSGDGVLSGTPALGSTGTYPITITAMNGVAPDATQSFTLTVLPIGITTTSLPDGSVYSKTNKVLYSTTLLASGGNPPCKWTLSSGSLPPGLKLSSKGVISGKPKTAGTYSFSVRVVDTKTKTKPRTQNMATATLSIAIS